MDVRLLGHVATWVGARRLDLGPRKQRFVLAVLALEANRQVAVDRLVELAWPVSPPRTAEHAVRVCVSGLRAVLASAGVAGTEAELVTQGSGYALMIDPERVDAHRFTALLAQARRVAGDQPRIALLDRALALWTGPALAGAAPDDVAARLCGGLEEARLVAQEDRCDALLRLGRHREAAGELTGLVAAHPTRERLVGQLMLALHRGGQTGLALETYRRTRRLLADELGLDPGAELRRLELALLRDDPGLRAVAGDEPRAGPVRTPADPPVVPPPGQLPAAAGGFVGRADQLRELDGILDRDGQAPAAVVIAAIGGTAGMGKTALAVQWAHRVRDRFPDGQLYLNLRGYDTNPPVAPIQALAQFLRSLGVPAAEVPLDVDEAAARYRSLVAGRRMLIVLDNAASPEQVRPLLPGGPGCFVLITSRDRLAGLVARDGARLLTLGVLSGQETHALLAGVLGRERVDAEPEAAARLARLCGYLPLALRIAAANLAVRPHTTLARYVIELGGSSRLVGLSVDGDERSAVRGAFDLSYASLKPAPRRLFRLLGLVPGADLSLPAAAALAGTGVEEVRVTLDRLAQGHLVEEPGPDRFACHDLLRLYARSLAGSEEAPGEVEAAVGRLCGYYVRATDAAADLLYRRMLRLPRRPDEPAGTGPVPAASFADPAEALAWLDRERVNLVALVRHAAGPDGPHAVAWWLADALRGYFHLRRHMSDWLAVAGDGLRAAEADGHRDAQAAAQLSLGTAYFAQQDNRRAIGHFTAALERSGGAGWPDGEAAALSNLGMCAWKLGDLPDAARYYGQALTINRRTGRTAGQAITLDNLGVVYETLGRLAEARRCHEQALELHRRVDPFGQGPALANLGELHLRMGQGERAERVLTEGLALYRANGSRNGEAIIMYSLAAVYRDGGNFERALELGRAGLALAQEIGERRTGANAALVLAGTCHELGRYEESVGYYREALGLADASGSPQERAEALIGLAGVLLRLDRPGPAAEGLDEAFEILRRGGYRLLEADALTALAAVHSARQRPADAVSAARRALSIRRQTGYRQRQEHARQVLRLALRQRALAPAPVPE